MKAKVGKEYPDGTFEGEGGEFEGREVAVWEGPRTSIDPSDQFLVTVRLYEHHDDYRVHETIWSASGLPTERTLYPVVGYLGYGTYTEQEARDKWGRCSERCNTRYNTIRSPGRISHSPPTRVLLMYGTPSRRRT